LVQAGVKGIISTVRAQEQGDYESYLEKLSSEINLEKEFED